MDFLGLYKSLTLRIKLVALTWNVLNGRAPEYVHSLHQK
jgi:hypothetical protein